jgi:hypothetical protein
MNSQFIIPGMMSAAASLGAIHLWNNAESLNEIDKFQHSNEEYIKSGSLLAFGEEGKYREENIWELQ